jgi:RHS repeat-associated protein
MSQEVTYSNAAGQTTLAVFIEPGSSPRKWATYYRYDKEGRQLFVARPSAVAGYDEAKADLVGYVKDTDPGTLGNQSDAIHISDDDGLIELTSYYADDAMEGNGTTAAGARGYVSGTAVREGLHGADVPQASMSYIKRTADGRDTYHIGLSSHYVDIDNDDDLDLITTTTAYTWQSSTSHQPLKVTTTDPAVDAARNGSGSATSSARFYDAYGRLTWSVDEAGYWTYAEYDVKTGAVTKRIIDAATGMPETRNGSLPTALNLVHLFEVDEVGRTVKYTDPNGNVTRTVYKDADHETRTYTGVYLDGSTWKTTGPIAVSRHDRAGNYYESFALAADPDVTGTDTFTGAEAVTAAAIRSLSRTYMNDAGQVTHEDAYTDLGGLTYATTGSLGTAGVNYLRTTYGYDQRGRQNKVVASDGTVTRTVYDAPGRAVSVWKGTNDAGATSTDPTGGGASGNNMVKVSESVYDAGGVGDGDLTESRAYHGNSAYYATVYAYDFRNRLTGQRGPDGVATLLTLDNLGQTVQVETIADADADLVRDPGELRSRSVTAYDERGQAFASYVLEVDPSTGAAGDKLYSYAWYDARGNAVKSSDANGLFSKQRFDGAGRLEASYLSFDTDETSYADADDVAGDTVMEQQEFVYDDAGNTILTRSRQRFHDAADSLTGDLGGPSSSGSTAKARVYYAASYYDRANRLTDSVDVGTNGGSAYTRPSTVPARSDTALITSYGYDDAGRLQWVWQPEDAKTGSGSALYAGATRFFYDLLGRRTKMVENYANGAVGETEHASDRTTQWIYDDGGRLNKMRARNPKGAGNGVEFQETIYLFGDPTDRSLVTTTVYPDSPVSTSSGTSISALSVGSGRVATVTSSGHGLAAGDVVFLDLPNASADERWVEGWYKVLSAPSSSTFTVQLNAPIAADSDSGEDENDASPNLTGAKALKLTSDAVRVEYDRLGRQTKMTDQRGVVHRYLYDAAGRVAFDSVTSFGPSGLVDELVQSIGYSYDDQSRLRQITSYDDIDTLTLAGDDPLNQVQYEYDGWGNVARTYQEHSGLVNDASESGADSPSVQYGYAEHDTASGSASDGNAEFVRLSTVTYPDGRVVAYTYGAEDGVDDKLSRLAAIKEGTGSGAATIESYSYLGAGTIVQRSQPGAGVAGSSGTGMRLTYVKQTGESDGDGGDQYAGLDRFGRVVDQRWLVTRSFKHGDFNGDGLLNNQDIDPFVQALGATSAYAAAYPDLAEALPELGDFNNDDAFNNLDISGFVAALTGSGSPPADFDATVHADRSRYGYDRASDRLWEQNLKPDTSELYAYDGLHRLTQVDRGTLSTSGTPSIATASRSQSWTLDALGNSAGVTTITVSGNATNTVTENRGHNAVNEITSVTGTDQTEIEIGPGGEDELGGGSPGMPSSGGELGGGGSAGSDLDAAVEQLYTLWLAATPAEEQVSLAAFRESLGLPGKPSGGSPGTPSEPSGGSLGGEDIDLDFGSFTWAQPNWDDRGNLIGSFKPSARGTALTFVWDAWDRMVAVKEGSTTLASYAFDGRGYRVSETVTPVGGGSAVTTHNYYNDGWQLIEQRAGTATTAKKQFIWSAAYIDALVQQQEDTNADGTLDRTLYATQDANYNVTGVFSTAGVAQERYQYDPYGRRDVLNARWAKQNTDNGSSAASGVGFEFGHQGGRYDLHSGFMLFRNRLLSPELMRWVSRDPSGYTDGANLYEGVRSSPQDLVDPSGLGAGKIVGYVVRRVGGKLIRGAVIYTEKHAAELFLKKGLDVAVTGGKKAAMKVARIVTGGDKTRIISGGNHAAGHWLERFGRRGVRHVQIDDIPNRHIFYSVLTAAMVVGASDAVASAECDYVVHVDSVYDDPRPGPSALNALTFSYWAGEDSWLALADWVNPLELAAAAGDGARWIDRQIESTLLGVTVTVSRRDGGPIATYALDVNGNLVSVGRWNESGELSVQQSWDYLKSIDDGSDPVLGSLAEFVQKNGR